MDFVAWWEVRILEVALPKVGCGKCNGGGGDTVTATTFELTRFLMQQFLLFGFTLLSSSGCALEHDCCVWVLE